MRTSPFTLRSGPPPLHLGLLTGGLLVAATTAVIFPLKAIAPVVATSILYLVAVLAVSTFWGVRLGIVTSVAAALAFNFFHIEPTGRFTISDGENWVALSVFLVVAVFTSSLANLARTRAREAELRRREADLAADLARILLGAPAVADALAPAAARIAAALEIESAALVLGSPPSDARRDALVLDAGGRAAALVVSAGLAPSLRAGLRQRLVPALEALLAAALQREELTAALVETEALRRSDDLKTAVLRAVSHDLRSPLTAIVAAGDALGSPALPEEDRAELSAAVGSEARRLARLVDQLLDLSRLEAGAIAPRTDWCSLEEVLRAAIDGLPGGAARTDLVVADRLPEITADAAQLERVFSNLIENALRHGGPGRVTVRTFTAGDRAVVRVVDRGRGIAPAEHERIFEPFHRADESRRSSGSGLGLAVARGFLDANGGTIRVESLPGQGATFVVEFQLPPPGQVLQTHNPRLNRGLQVRRDLRDCKT